MSWDLGFVGFKIFDFRILNLRVLVIPFCKVTARP